MKQITCPACKTKMKKDGKIFRCEACLKTLSRQEAEVYSRVVGYIRPTSQWNEGKAQEFKDRKVFGVEDEV